MARSVPLMERSRGPNRNVCIRRATREIVAELSQREYADLALPGASAPPGVKLDEWVSGEIIALGGVPDYGNGVLGKLAHGEFAELPDRYEVGIAIDDRLVIARIDKAKVNASRAGGLTVTKTRADAWPDSLGIVSIVSGQLTTEK